MAKVGKRFQAWARIAPGPKGRKPQYSYLSQEEADQKARALEVRTKELLEQAASRVLQPDSFPPDSFGHFVYNVWAPHVYPGKAKSTVRKYDELLVNHILPALAWNKIADIGYDDFKRMKAGLKRADRKVLTPLPNRQAAEVIYRSREIMGLYNRLASAKREPTRDDWRLATAPKKPGKKKRLPPEKGFTERFLKVCEPHERGIHFSALFLGLRRGEACGLLKNKINRSAMTLTVSEQMPEDGGALIPVKGGEDRERTIPITPKLLAHLDKLMSKGSIFAFTDKKGRPWMPNELSKTTPKICARDETLPRTGFHDLRSHAASNLAEIGTDPFVIMELLGHSELDTTIIYVNAKSAQKRAAIDKMLEGLVDETG